MQYATLAVMAEMKRRKKANFSEDDKQLLIRLISANLKTIESKKSDMKTNTAKTNVWQEINLKFNAQSSVKRDKGQLKELWKRLKCRAKKDVCRLKKHRKGITGVEPTEDIDETSQTILGLIPDEFHKLASSFDDDNDHLGSTLPKEEPVWTNDTEGTDEVVTVYVDESQKTPPKTESSSESCSLPKKKKRNSFAGVKDVDKVLLATKEHVDTVSLDLATEEHSAKLALLHEQRENEILKGEVLLQQLKCEETRYRILQIQLTNLQERQANKPPNEIHLPVSDQQHLQPQQLYSKPDEEPFDLTCTNIQHD